MKQNQYTKTPYENLLNKRDYKK